MKPEIYDIDGEKRHLFYGDYLVVNLPAERTRECLDDLSAGRLYEYPRGAKRALASLGNSKAENNPELCTTFVWDEKARLIVRDADYDLVLQRQDVKIPLSSKGYARKKDPLKAWLLTGSKKGSVSEQSALKDWLVQNVEARGYKPEIQKRPFYTHKDAVIAGCIFLCAVALIYVFAGQYRASHDQTELLKILAATVVGLGALGYAVKKWFAAKNLTEPVYLKNKN